MIDVMNQALPHCTPSGNTSFMRPHAPWVVRARGFGRYVRRAATFAVPARRTTNEARRNEGTTNDA
jgi:hypothetical protein